MMNPFLEENIREVMVKSIASHFVGRVCTIMTSPPAIPIKDHIQHSQYYTGEVTGVDSSGVWIKHPQNGTLAFYAFPIQGIVEEQYIAPTDPRHEKIKEELAKKEREKEKAKVAPPVMRPRPPQGATPLISVDELSARLKQSKGS